MQRSKSSKLRWRAGGSADGWVLTGNNATPWLHLASWSLTNSQLSWESKMEPECGNIAPSLLHLESWKLPDSQLSWEYKSEPECGKKIIPKKSNRNILGHKKIWVNWKLGLKQARHGRISSGRIHFWENGNHFHVTSYYLIFVSFHFSLSGNHVWPTSQFIK